MIRLQDLSLQRGGHLLLDNASLQVHPGWKIGLCGRNGSGKSSLLSVLNRSTEVDGGELSVPEHWRIATMQQEITQQQRSALDYVLDGHRDYRQLQEALEHNPEDPQLHEAFAEIDGYSLSNQASALLHGLGFQGQSIYQDVGTFSGGWQIRLNLARALLTPSDLLLLDEPTNHLDLDATLWLEQWLKQYPGTLILISHDRDFLDQITNYIVLLEQQQLKLFQGNYTTYERQRAEQLAQQQAAYEKQQRRRAEIDNFVRRFRAKATKARQAQSRLKELARMEDIAPAHADSPFEFSLPCSTSASGTLLNLAAVSVGYDGQAILQHIDLTVLGEQRIGLLGPNGAGKSTFIKALAGELSPLSGTRTPSAQLKIGYFTQHQLDSLDPEASPLLHLQRLSPRSSEQELRNFLGGYGFQGDRVFDAAGVFSGGEKSRLALALLAWQQPNLLLLDEPTNHLDLEMRHALTLALQAFEGAVMIISHDRHLLRSTVDEFWLVADGTVQTFDGDLDDYRLWLSQRQDSGETTAKPRVSRKVERQLAAQQREKLRPLSRRLKTVEQQLEATQNRLDDLDSQLADNSLYNGDQAHQLQALLKQQGQLRLQLDELELEWMSLSEQLEDFTP